MNINKLSDFNQDTLRKHYADLPKYGTFKAELSDYSFSEASFMLETAGFAAITLDTEIIPPVISGIKAKDGECYETGRSAYYRGHAIAAVDDDNHLVFEELRVCEKTGSVYMLPPYKGIVDVTEADPAMLSKLDNAPIPFDCNTYERDLAELLKITDKNSVNEEERVKLLYHGPFRLLILKDGTIIRRGEICETAKSDAEAICKEGGRIISSSHTDALVPGNLHTLYEAEGSGVLLNDFPVASMNTNDNSTDLSSLKVVNDEILRRIRKMIVNCDRYFILTGSSPSDPDGCCPSLEVGEAEKLVDSGILSSYLKPAPPDACPVTIFAIKGELSSSAGKLDFKENSELREEILNHLN